MTPEQIKEARARVDDLQLVAKCLKGENKFPTGQSVILEAADALTAALDEIERLRRGREGDDMALARAAYNAGRKAEQDGYVARDPRVILSHARAALGMR